MPADASVVVHLVDASPYIFRAYHSLPASLEDPEGRPVGAVYGFTAFLIKLLGEEEPSHLAVAFDHSLVTSFRTEIYPGYKARRQQPPEDLEAQQEDCREAAAALGAVTLEHRRYEADDLIATLCRRLVGEGHAAVVVSSDKDLAQLVEERVSLYDFARNRRYTPEEVRRKFSVEPGQIPDLLALAGDPVDDIPGVRGIGPKTAATLLERFSDLESLLEGLEGVPDLDLRGAASVARKLRQGSGEARLSRRLAVLEDDCPVEVSMEDLRYRGADADQVDALFRRLGFQGLRERIPRWAGDGGS